MITQIDIKNIQSHKKTVLNLSPGINIISGQSNSGKSAILRSLYWLLFNNSLGSKQLANYDICKKGKFVDSFSVSILVDNTILSRCRGSDENNYILDGAVYDAVRTEVPDNIVRFLNISQINFHRQFDGFFMFSSTAGEVGRQFNKLVNLECIDSILSKVDSDVRGTKNRLNNLQEQIKDIDSKLTKFSNIESLEYKLSSYDKLFSSKELVNSKLKSIIGLVSSYKKTTGVIERLKKCLNTTSFIEKIKFCMDKKTELNKKLVLLSTLRLSYRDVIRRLKIVGNYTNYNIKDIVDKLSKLDSIKSRISNFSSYITNYKMISGQILENFKKLEEYRAKLPNICPVCGGSFKI